MINKFSRKRPYAAYAGGQVIAVLGVPVDERFEKLSSWAGWKVGAPVRFVSVDVVAPCLDGEGDGTVVEIQRYTVNGGMKCGTIKLTAPDKFSSLMESLELMEGVKK